ncbi:MAG: cytochrome oxidase small assembly protein [Burkholderiales bacterium]|nr:cytochrome oxidase small assembly protein [Burkholderiales bacterium]
MSQDQDQDQRHRGTVRTGLILAGVALFFFIAIIINKS